MFTLQLCANHTVAIVLGIVVHLGIFIRGEWHIQAPTIFRSYITFILFVFLLNCRLFDQGCLSSFIVSLTFLSYHFSALIGSILLYRCCFHPLRQFPGPSLTRISKLWHAWCCRNSQNHLLLEALRGEYGDFVRTGPNESTIFHPGGLNAITNAENSERSGWYDLLHPSFSLNTVRNQHLHDRRRKVWEPAFTTEAMRDYETRIRGYGIMVDREIRNSAGNSVNINSIAYNFAYNVMRDLAFAQTPDEGDREWQTSVETIHTGLSILGPLSPAPWIALLVFSFTRLKLVNDWNKMMAYCQSKMAERLVMPSPERRDISSWLIEDAEKRGCMTSQEEMRWLNGDAFTMILAGSDTTASTLVFAFWYLAKNPRYQAQIYDEIERSCVDDPHVSGLTYKELERLTFLNAFINETLRLHHPLPTAGSKVVRQSGLTIGGVHIPPGTEVVAPRWSFGRQEAHFEDAWKFLPERWIAGSGLHLDRRAFTPWASGKWSCLGKQVALFELRYLLALILHNYTVSLPPGDDGQSVVRDYKDQVTAFPGQLNLVFHIRRLP